MSLLLVNAPYPRALKFYGQPMPLLYAAALTVPWLESRGQPDAVELVNYGLMQPAEFRACGPDDLRERIRRRRPRLVAISTTTASLPAARRLAAAAKDVDQPPLVALGGPHEDDVPEAERTAVWDPNVDFSVSGDGESALLVLLRAALDAPDAAAGRLVEWIGRSKHDPDPYGSSQITCRSVGRNPAWTTTLLRSPRGAAVPLESLPPPPRHLLHPDERYHYPIFRDGSGAVKPTAQVMTQRGCIAKCAFCSESQRLLTRSVSNVVAELEGLKARGYRAVFFDDSTFTATGSQRRRFLAELGQEMRRIDLEWGCQTRVDMVDDELLSCLADSSCTYIYFGVESMVPELLLALNKHYDPPRIRTALEGCRKVGIRVGASLLLGAPDFEHRSLETIDTARRTFTEIREFVDRGPIEIVSLNLFGYYPGTTSTVDLARREPEIQTYKDFDWDVGDQFPFNLVEENPAFSPKGLRESAEPILLLAHEILGDVIVGGHGARDRP